MESSRSKPVYLVIVTTKQRVIEFEVRADRASDARRIAREEFPGAVQVTAYECQKEKE